MRYRLLAILALTLSVAPAAFAQEALQPANDDAKPTLQQRLMPENAASLLAPAAVDLNATAETQPTAAMRPAGSGTGLMIAGAALFIAGLIVGGDAGTLVAVTGAAIGAYGLYQYFR